MPTERQKGNAWNKAEDIGGKNPNLYRKDKFGNVLYKPSYGKDSEMGWEIDHSKPKSKGGTDHPNNLQIMQTGAAHHPAGAAHARLPTGLIWKRAGTVRWALPQGASHSTPSLARPELKAVKSKFTGGASQLSHGHRPPEQSTDHAAKANRQKSNDYPVRKPLRQRDLRRRW